MNQLRVADYEWQGNKKIQPVFGDENKNFFIFNHKSDNKDGSSRYVCQYRTQHGCKASAKRVGDKYVLVSEHKEKCVDLSLTESTVAVKVLLDNVKKRVSFFKILIIN